MKYWYILLSMLISFSAVGQSGNALSFNGNSVVNGGSAVNHNLTSGTWEAWVKLEEGNNHHRIIFKENSSGTGHYELFYYAGTSVFRGEVIADGIRYAVESSTNPELSVWYHVAVSYDGVNLKIYVNGVYENTAFVNAGSIDNNDGPLGIGGNNVNPLSGEVAMIGEIDEVRIWSTVRTPEQISSTANLPLGSEYTSSSDSGLVAYYPFDEESGSTTEDKSVNSNDASITGAVFVPSGASLPVELIEFSSTSDNGNIILHWSTLTESNNAGWEIEGKQNPHNPSSINVNGGFSKIGFVSGKGTTTESQNYSFTFSSSEFKVQSHQFRLKQIDTDGNFSYSNILTVNLTADNFSLSQNYPNPFNPNTAISYQLSAVSHVKLVVFDVLGREVMTLVNEEKPSGTFTVTFDASHLASGIYFYTLTAGSTTKTKWMSLVK